MKGSIYSKAVIYGANASGKSNLVVFMRFFKATVETGLPVWSILSKAYLEGRYGAIPVFKKFSFGDGE